MSKVIDARPRYVISLEAEPFQPLAEKTSCGILPSLQTESMLLALRRKDHWPSIRHSLGKSHFSSSTSEVIRRSFTAGFDSIYVRPDMEDIITKMKWIVEDALARSEIQHYLTPAEEADIPLHLATTYEFGYDAGQLANPMYKGKEA